MKHEFNEKMFTLSTIIQQTIEKHQVKLEKLEQAMKKIEISCDDISMDKPVITFLGMESSGKSSLLNALFEKPSSCVSQNVATNCPMQYDINGSSLKDVQSGDYVRFFDQNHGTEWTVHQVIKEGDKRNERNKIDPFVFNIKPMIFKVVLPKSSSTRMHIILEDLFGLGEGNEVQWKSEVLKRMAMKNHYFILVDSVLSQNYKNIFQVLHDMGTTCWPRILLVKTKLDLNGSAKVLQSNLNSQCHTIHVSLPQMKNCEMNDESGEDAILDRYKKEWSECMAHDKTLAEKYNWPHGGMGLEHVVHWIERIVYEYNQHRLQIIAKQVEYQLEQCQSQLQSAETFNKDQVIDSIFQCIKT